jgi:hypothetical protein
MSNQLINFVKGVVNINAKFTRFIRRKREEKFGEVLRSLCFTLGPYELLLLVNHDCLEFQIEVF